jgi:probable rRNA maturation factor
MILKIVRLSKARLPKLPYGEAARKILGENYELDLIFADSRFVKNLERQYLGRKKDTNILSFPLSKSVGEIVMNPEFIKKEALNYKVSFKRYLFRLFLHGILHLKGFRHGREMEREEIKFQNRYG